MVAEAADAGNYAGEVETEYGRRRGQSCAGCGGCGIWTWEDSQSRDLDLATGLLAEQSLQRRVEVCRECRQPLLLTRPNLALVFKGLLDLTLLGLLGWFQIGEGLSYAVIPLGTLGVALIATDSFPKLASALLVCCASLLEFPFCL